MSAPSWTQSPEAPAVAFHRCTRACPALLPAPSLAHAPTARVVTSADSDTEIPELSSAASPSMSAPSWTQSPEAPAVAFYQCLMLRSAPVPSLKSAPMARMVPSADSEIETPELPPKASPSMSAPIGIGIGIGIGIQLVHLHAAGIAVAEYSDREDGAVG